MLRIRRQPFALHIRSAECEVAGWGFGLEAAGARVPLSLEQVVSRRRVVEVVFTGAQQALVWVIRIEKDGSGGRLVVSSEITNRSWRAVPLGKAWLLESAGPVRVGSAGGDLVCLPLPGHIVARPVYRTADPACPRSSKIKAQFYDRSARAALQVGFLTFRRANTEVCYDIGPDGRLCGLRAFCDFAGWELGPGATTATEVFTVAAGRDPYAQLEQWADLAAERCVPRRWESAPVGWVGWSWVDGFTAERYEDVVLRNCRAIRRRLAGYGVNYVWVSIGNLATAPGDWTNWNRELFPDGPECFAAKLRELGFVWGLWCAPFWVCSSVVGELPGIEDALLKGEDGSPLVVRTEWQFGSAGKLPRAERPCLYALDPSHPKALALVREAFTTCRRWGVRYYMLDFLHAGAGNIGEFPYACHHDPGLVAGPEVYHRFLRVIREAAGDDTYFLSSSGPSVHNAGAVDAARTGNDFGEGRPLYPDSYFYPATYIIDRGEFWTGPKAALRNQASAWYTHRRLYLNDSGNVLTVDKPLPLSDAQIHATIHALSGGPTMIGDDVDRMDEERLALIKKTLPRPRDAAIPVDLFDAVHPDWPKVFHRRVTKPWGRFDVVAVYNFGPGLLTQAVDLGRLGLDRAAPYLVWEFWDGRYLGRATGTLDAVVPPHSVRVYRLTADEGRPVVLGTDMHLLMGEMELADVSWDPVERVLSGRALRPAGERGSVFLHAPQGLCVADPRGIWIAKDGADASLILRCALEFAEGEAAWSVRFAQLAGAAAIGPAEPG